MYGGALMVAVGVFYLAFERKLLAKSRMSGDSTAPADNLFSRSLIGAQIGLILLAMVVTRSSAMSLQAKTGLPRGNQIVGLRQVAPLIMPFLHRLQPNNHYLHRLMVIFLTFAPTFVLLTISYEGLFYLAFSATLITWVLLEHSIYTYSITSAKKSGTGVPEVPASLSSSPFRSLTLTDARISLFFLTLLQSAFFSTGNMASISSFSLESVNRIIPVFDPFSQGGLLILKLMIPFALISANLGILNKRLGVAPSALFMVVIAISDFLTLHFFWVVKDEGSWLEIGSTISHFCIASLLCLFVASLEGVSELFIAGVEVEDNSSQLGKERELGGIVMGKEPQNAVNGAAKPTEKGKRN
ncbi:GPI ethanolamine phosphate transferase 1 protein [Rutstroemia sp. NJR-2017a BBW]|nr:GPI ethanolamine phosphate transferase 1 protein [Rutstroemia sp. NJR-2017a BBW]